MNIRLDDKIALITGAGSGIGQAMAEEFAAAGAFVYVADLRAEEGQAVVDRIKAAGFDAAFSQVDVTDQAAMLQLVETVTARHGRVDILVNNAGVAHIGKLENTGESDFDRVYAVNVKGVYNGMYAVIGQMQAQGGGVILNMGSIAAELGLPDRFAYSMSKAAVLSMTYTVARDYVKAGIRCNAIAPARIHTPFVDGFLAQNYPGEEEKQFARLAATQPIGRMGTPQEVAALALYLCADQAGFITGTNFPIDGGFIKLNT